MSLEAQNGSGRNWDSTDRAQGYQVTPVQHVHRYPSTESGAAATVRDSRRDTLEDSRNYRNSCHLGCFKWLITSSAKALISH